MDFASKCVAFPTETQLNGGMGDLLKGLGNARDEDIIKNFAGNSILVGVVGDSNRVVFATKGPLAPLALGLKYK